MRAEEEEVGGGAKEVAGEAGPGSVVEGKAWAGRWSRVVRGWEGIVERGEGEGAGRGRLGR